MSMPPEPDAQPDGQSTNPIMRKVAGLPVIVWVLIVAAIAFIWFSRRGGGLFGGSKSSGINTSGGGGSATSGRTTIDKGAVQITVTQGNRKQPGPPVHKKKSRMVTVPNVVGEEWFTASKQIKAKGLKPERTRPYSGRTEEETPSGGTKVRKGSVIELSGRTDAR